METRPSQCARKAAGFERGYGGLTQQGEWWVSARRFDGSRTGPSSGSGHSNSPVYDDSRAGPWRVDVRWQPTAWRSGGTSRRQPEPVQGEASLARGGSAARSWRGKRAATRKLNRISSDREVHATEAQVRLGVDPSSKRRLTSSLHAAGNLATKQSPSHGRLSHVRVFSILFFPFLLFLSL